MYFIMNAAVRKMSARLITELLFENNGIKERLIEILGVNPGVGNVRVG